MPNPSLEALRAYRDRLKKAGKLIEARTVARCMALIKEAAKSHL